MIAFEQVWMWLDMLEFALSACKQIWASMEHNWMCLNERECAWTPLSRYSYVSAHLKLKLNAVVKQTVILNIHNTRWSIRDLIVTTSVSTLAIVQERFGENHLYHMYNWKTSWSQKYEASSDLFCTIKSNFTVFLGGWEAVLRSCPPLKKSDFRTSRVGFNNQSVIQRGLILHFQSNKIGNFWF